MVFFSFLSYWWPFCTLFRHRLFQWPFCIFAFAFLPIFDREFFLLFFFPPILIGNFLFFLCFPPIFDWGFSLFLLFFEAHSQLNSRWNLFLGDPSVLSSKGKGKIPIRVKAYVRRIRFCLKRLAEDRTWHMSGYWFGKRLRDKGNAPHYFHDTHITIMI